MVVHVGICAHRISRDLWLRNHHGRRVSGRSVAVPTYHEQYRSPGQVINPSPPGRIPRWKMLSSAPSRCRPGQVWRAQEPRLSGILHAESLAQARASSYELLICRSEASGAPMKRLIACLSCKVEEGMDFRRRVFKLDFFAAAKIVRRWGRRKVGFIEVWPKLAEQRSEISIHAEVLRNCALFHTLPLRK